VRFSADEPSAHARVSLPSDTSGPSASRYYTLPANLAHPLPESISFDEGAMIEPLAVRPGQVVAVFGAGPVGLLAAAVAKALGAKRVIVVGLSYLRFSRA
jgi:D-xylulose reductase